MKVAEAIRLYLEKMDLSHFFGVSGANIEDLFFALRKSDSIKTIIAKHEAGAVAMAEGYFYKTGKLGVVLTTSGGGAFQTLAPLTEALSSRIPLLVIVGQIPSYTEGQGAFQDSSGIYTPVNALEIFSAVCVAAKKLDEYEEILNTLDYLISEAFSRTGPTALLIPSDFLKSDIDFFHDPRIAKLEKKLGGMEELERALCKIRDAKNIVTIGGEDIHTPATRELFTGFINATGSLVALTPDAKGIWDHYDDRFVGLVGVMGHDSAFEALANADLVIIVGTALPVFSRIPTIDALRDKYVILIHDSPSFIEKSDVKGIDILNIIGDIYSCLAFLLNTLRENGNRKGSIRKSAPRNLEIGQFNEGKGTYLFSMNEVIDVINTMLPEDADVFADAGNTGAAVIHGLNVRGRGIFNVALGMGAMGHSFGCAIGASAARDTRAFVFAGDGAFYMCGMEIHTAREYVLPITFIIFNNNAHAMCYTREMVNRGSATSANLFKTSAIGSGLKEMLPGIMAFEVNKAGELRDALKIANAFHGPSVISINTDYNEIPPFRNFISRKEKST